jgi:16S rRNA (guanine527-N7)-methyltransferase
VTSREFNERVTRRARKANLSLSAELLSGLETYYKLLESWNTKINLTSLDLGGGGDDAVDRLLIEPLVAVRYLPRRTSSLVDIGSGGGSPAIPMKLSRPEVAFTLVEAKTRKSAFLREAGRQLEIEFQVETARYEALLTRPELHEAFDVLTMRAVRVEPRTLFGLQAFVRPAGAMLLFRGPSGPNAPAPPPPPLYWESTHLLVDALQSRLTVLRKMDYVGGI